MSNATRKKVYVAMIFNRLTNDELVSAGGAAVKGLDGNPKVPNLPISITDLKTGLQGLSTAVAAAQDGGKTAIAEQRKQRTAFIKMMKKEAVYVEEIADTDPTVITTAGFQVKTGPVPSQQLPAPVIDKAVQKALGQMVTSFSPIAGGRMYQVHWGEQGPGGTFPTAWTTLEVAKARPAPLITGLTPGKVYVFQVRVFGTVGWSEWSEPVTKMST
jgi:hypothetical protein